VDCGGETTREPLGWTAPTLSMLTSVALLVSQLRVVDAPLSTVLGFAVSDAVGAAGGGGGGGGGGAAFFLHALRNITALNASSKPIHFSVCFTFSSLQIACPDEWRTLVFSHQLPLDWRTLVNESHFQLQFGCELRPDAVTGFCAVPSASMVQICSVPERFDWKTM
jgi:hypothetical protein